MKTSWKSFTNSTPSGHRAGIGILILLFLFALAGPARADILDNILGKVNDIKGDTDAMRPKINNMEPRVVNTETMVDQLRAEARQAFTNVARGLVALTGDNSSFVNEAIGLIHQKVQGELAGRDDFLNNHAAQFRTNINTFLCSIEDIIRTLSDMTGTNIPFSLTNAKSAIASVPDRALYPLYRALNVSIDFGKIAGQLSDAAAQVAIMAQGLAPDSCQIIVDNHVLFENAESRAKIISVSLKLAGKLLEALGEADLDLDVGIHGYFHVTFKGGTAKTLGKNLGGVADAIGSVSDSIKAKLVYCTMVDRVDRLMAKANQLSVDMAALDSMVNSRASQASVDALAVSIGGLDTAPLDVTVSSRATQDSVDALTTKVMDQESTALRIQIELQLSDNTRHPSVFYLPEARGGMLGLVRSIVVQTLATNQAAGIYTGTLAGQELANGDAAAATNDFRGAFDSYRRAYQEITKWPVTASIGNGQDVGDLALTWPSDRGGIYRVERSTDLANWSVALPKVVGAAGQTAVELMPSGTAAFYRVFRLSSYDPTVNRS